MRGSLRQTQMAWYEVVAAVVAVVAIGGGGHETEAARILGIFPTPSISHQLPFQAVMKALAARGHQITVISTDPLKEPVANYTDIDFSFSYPTFRKNLIYAEMAGSDAIATMKMYGKISPIFIEEQLNSTEFKKFLKENGNQKYDLVFLQWLFYQSYFGLIHAVGSPPIIGILSHGGLPNAFNAIGNPNNPAFNPELVNKYSDRMNIWERLYNTYIYVYTTYFWHYEFMPVQEALMRKYFGDAAPPVEETEKNMSLLIVNNHWTTDYPRAMLPNVITLTGLHVKEDPGSLPKELQQWMDAAGKEGGVIYFSLGSNVMSKDLPEPKRAAILRVFSRLPLRVMWKWEEDELPGCPPNVRISKWFPQQAVLAHPSVRLFITQGGLQSFQEAVFHAVPLLGIPFLADQPYNVKKMVSAEVGRRLEFSDLTEDSFYHEINAILSDQGYKERMRQFSIIYREHKSNSLDNAIWWVEYVLRHNGAHHLRSGALHLAWYQHLLLDVVAFILLSAAVSVYAARLLLRTVFGLLFGGKQKHYMDSGVSNVRKRQ